MEGEIKGGLRSVFYETSQKKSSENSLTFF